MSLAIVKTHSAAASFLRRQRYQHRDFALFIEGFKVHRSETVWYDGNLAMFDPPRPCAGAHGADATADWGLRGMRSVDSLHS